MGCASLGFRQAGFEIATALEINPIRCEVYESNLKVKPIIRDVMNVDGKQILKAGKIRKTERFCIVGCPPCQSFSKLSDTTSVNASSDPRSKYVKKFAKIIEETKPTAVVFENVAWMVKGPGKKFFEYYLKKLEKAGYSTVFNTVNAADFNVPQNRHRVIAISIKKKHMTQKVQKSLQKFLNTKKRNHKTVKDAIKDLKPISVGKKDIEDNLHFSRNHDPKVLKIIKAIPKNGGSRTQLPRNLWLECHKKIKHGADSVYGRMWWDKPAPTMTCRCTTPACGRFIHPSQNRGISLREAMRIQTIPDNFQMGGNRQRAEEMIGDAVPVHLAKRIGIQLMQILP